MLVETDEVVLLEDCEDLAESLIGGIWVAFKEAIPAPQATVLIKGFNLIILSDASHTNEPDLNDDDFLTAVTDSLLPGMITNILVDESQTIASQKMAVFEIITNNIIEILLNMGFSLNDDEVSHEQLPELCQMLDFFYEMDAYEDLIGIGPLLQSTDIDPVDRFLLAMRKYLGENADLSVHELILSDVSEVTLKTISDNLVYGEVTEALPESIVKRVRENLSFMSNTLAYNHVINNGQVGGDVKGYLAFFQSELGALLNDESEAAAVQYAREVGSLFLISEVNTGSLRRQLQELLYSFVNNHLALIHVESCLNEMVLSDD